MQAVLAANACLIVTRPTCPPVEDVTGVSQKARLMLQNCPRALMVRHLPEKSCCEAQGASSRSLAWCAVDSNRTERPKKAKFKIVCVPALPPEDSLLPIRSCCSKTTCTFPPQTSPQKGVQSAPLVIATTASLLRHACLHASFHVLRQPHRQLPAIIQVCR